MGWLFFNVILFTPASSEQALTTCALYNSFQTSWHRSIFYFYMRVLLSSYALKVRFSCQGVVVHAFKPSTWQRQADLWIWGQSSLQSVFQNIEGFIEKACHKKKESKGVREGGREEVRKLDIQTDSKLYNRFILHFWLIGGITKSWKPVIAMLLQC